MSILYGLLVGVLPLPIFLEKEKLLQTENKILKDDIVTKQRLIDSLLQHNNLLITHQEGLTTELLTPK